MIHCTSSDVLSANCLQDGCPVMSVSRSLSNSKNHYVAIELECLTIVLPIIDRYIYGKRTAVETDHKLLEDINK